MSVAGYINIVIVVEQVTFPLFIFLSKGPALVESLFIKH